MRLRAPSLYAIGLAAILAGIFFRSLTVPIDPDLWWHLSTGSAILEQGAVPDRDSMSFTFHGQPWVAQSWLADVATELGYRCGGLWLIYAWYAAATALAFLLVHARMRLRAVPHALALSLLVAAALASATSWGPRVQIASLVLTASFLLLLDRYASTGAARELALLAPLMILWTNLHGAFVLGIALLAIECAAALLERERDRARALAITLAACLGTTALNPAGFDVWRFPLRTLLPDLFHTVISEAGSPDFHHPAFLPFELLLLTMIASFLVSRDFRWRDLLLAQALTHLALSQVRHVSVWAVAVTPIIGAHLASGWRDRGRGEVFTRTLSGRTRARLDLVVLVLVTAACTLIFTSELRRVDFLRDESANFPRAAVDRLAADEQRQRVFTTFEWGGYVHWRLKSRASVFIDGRANSLFDENLLREYLAIVRAGEGWPATLAARRVDAVVVPDSLPLARALVRSAEWQCTRDSFRVVLCRPSVRQRPHAAGAISSP